MILWIHWHDFVRNTEVVTKTNLHYSGLGDGIHCLAIGVTRQLHNRQQATIVITGSSQNRGHC